MLPSNATLPTTREPITREENMNEVNEMGKCAWECNSVRSDCDPTASGQQTVRRSRRVKRPQ